MVDIILQFLYDLISPLFNLLPDSPFQDFAISLNNQYGDIMGYINYFVPVGNLLVMLNLYISAVLVWYGIRWALRFAQYID